MSDLSWEFWFLETISNIMIHIFEGPALLRVLFNVPVYFLTCCIHKSIYTLNWINENSG